MANTARVTATVTDSTGANLTLAHNIGRTPHYVHPIPQSSSSELIFFTEVSRDASVYVVQTNGNTSVPCVWEVIYKHSAIR